MPLTTEQEDRLNAIFEALDGAKLNDWERGFLKDQVDRYNKYGAGLSLSPKQWSCLDKMVEKTNRG